MQASDGALYGTTSQGGSNNLGTVFRLNQDGSGYSVLYHFKTAGSDGRIPLAGLVEASDGFLLVRSFAAAPNFINNDGINGVPALDGPGVISPVSAPRPINISFNKIGPFIFNQGPFPDGTGFLDEINNTGQGFVWGSFDGTTNNPVVYPIGTSIQDLEQRVLGGH